jgi:drug/metabolite transporter (DMT)-like permease
MNRPDAPPSSLVGITFIVMTLLGWSSIPLFLRHFAESIDPWTSNGWRYGFSALLWLPVLLVAAGRRRLPRGLWPAAIVPSCFNALGQITFTYSHYKIDPGLLTFGLRTQIIFAAAGAYLLFPIERAIVRSPLYLAGGVLVILGTSGTLLLGGNEITGDYALGLVLAITSGMLFAGYGLAVRKYMVGMNSVLAFAAISQITAVALVILMLWRGTDFGLTAWRLPAGQFNLLLLSAVIGIALGHVFYYMSIARLGVAVSAGVLQLQPFGVAVGSYLLFNEVLSAGQWTSGFVAVAGAIAMLAVQWRLSHRRRRDARAAAALAAAGTPR